MCSQLKITGPDRFKVAPQSVVKDSIKKMRSEIDAILSVSENVEYLEKYVIMRSFLDSMKTVQVNSGRLDALIKSQQHDGVKSNLSSFVKPCKIKYSMSNSSTGRLSVLSGPKILTSPQEVKQVFKSRHKNGCILQIDLSCAEPNFALFISGKETKKDLYSFCSDEVLEGRVDRKTAKLVLLSALYGQSARNLKSSLPNGMAPLRVTSKVREFLSAPQLQESLRSKWSSGDLRNHLKRPLRPKQQRLLISHYLQSSVAEASILMFRDFCKLHELSLIHI